MNRKGSWGAVDVRATTHIMNCRRHRPRQTLLVCIFRLPSLNSGRYPSAELPQVHVVLDAISPPPRVMSAITAKPSMTLRVTLCEKRQVH